ncbi:hypothetical protein D3C72_1205100 [compost metagenome]
MADQGAHGGVVAGHGAAVRLGRLLGALASAGMHQHHRLALIATGGDGGQEVLGTADLFGEDYDRARFIILSEIRQEVLDAQRRLVPRRNPVGDRQVSRRQGQGQVRHHPAALGQDRHRLAVLGRQGGRHPAAEADEHRIDVVAIAQAVGPDQEHAARPRGGDQGVLGGLALLAQFGEAGGEDDADAHASGRTGLDRLQHGRRRDGQNGQVDAFGQFSDAADRGAAVDLDAAAANHVDLAVIAAGDQVVQGVAPGAAWRGRDADDGDRPRTERAVDRRPRAVRNLMHRDDTRPGPDDRIFRRGTATCPSDDRARGPTRPTSPPCSPARPRPCPSPSS